MSEQDTTVMALPGFLDTTEAGIASANPLIAEAKGVTQESKPWNPTQIKWNQAEGSHGVYEHNEDTASQGFRLLVKELIQYDGKLPSNGYFYWLFLNGSTVGRKKRT